MTLDEQRLDVEAAAAERIKEAGLEGLAFPEWFGFVAERDPIGMVNYAANIRAAKLPMFRALACSCACLWATYACDDTPEARFANRTYLRILERMTEKGLDANSKPIAWQLALQTMQEGSFRGLDLDKYEPMIVFESDVFNHNDNTPTKH